MRIFNLKDVRKLNSFFVDEFLIRIDHFQIIFSNIACNDKKVIRNLKIM